MQHIPATGTDLFQYHRWEENAAELLPEYMQDLYLHLLKTFDSCEDELGPNKSFRVFYLKELVTVVFDLT